VDKLFQVLTVDTFQVYSTYINGIYQYRINNLKAFDQLEYWFIKYLNTLCIEDSNFHLNTYKDYRLDSGAIMCVIYHNILFDNIKEVNFTNLNFYKEVSIIVSYHNDILSYNRDKIDGTPNLVSVLQKDINFRDTNDRNIFEYAIHLVNHRYKNIKNTYEFSDPYTIELSLTILEGSYNWTNREDRYKVGLHLLKHLLRGDLSKHYDRIMRNKKSTPGDPK